MLCCMTNENEEIIAKNDTNVIYFTVLVWLLSNGYVSTCDVTRRDICFRNTCLCCTPRDSDSTNHEARFLLVTQQIVDASASH